MRSTSSSIMRQQHREILGHIERLRELVDGQAEYLPPNHARTLIRQHLVALREVMAAHFAAEEDAGYFAELVLVREELRPRADRVQAQHAPILVVAAAAIANARHWSIPLLADKCRELTAMVLGHEQAERELVCDAALEDLSAAG